MELIDKWQLSVYFIRSILLIGQVAILNSHSFLFSSLESMIAFQSQVAYLHSQFIFKSRFVIEINYKWNILLYGKELN